MKAIFSLCVVGLCVLSLLMSGELLTHAPDLTHNMLAVTFILVLKIAVCIEQGISTDPTI
jgi:uncharacterized protein (DUF983 family)